MPMHRLKERSLVVCGTLRRELRKLAGDGLLDADRLFFTAPGLHERPQELERQVRRQMEKARAVSDTPLVVYGEKCFLDELHPTRDTDALLREDGSGCPRIRAKHCVDMIASEEERNAIARGDKVYWLTPGWLEHWSLIFKAWDSAKANETFPAYRRAVVLDAIGYFDELSANDPEKVLRIADWIKIPLEAHPVGLDRLKRLLGDCP
jgi:hypothetical protein